VFFGGGTPSLVPPDLLRRVLSALDARFGIHPDAEISAEMDPGTFDRAKLDAFVAAGVTRVSLGAQSFDPEVLKLAGRAHTVAETRRAIEWLGDVRSRVRTDAEGEKRPGDGTNATSSENGARTRTADERFRWSLDLISGLPGLTRDTWLASLREAIRHEPDHVSVYDLQVEEGTPFARWYSPGAHPLPCDSDAARMFRDASEVLRTEGGYEHYEVSSYAKRGARCLHNETYWDAGRRGWYAFGMAATSATGDARGRVARPRKMSEYYAWVDAMEGRAVPREGDEAREEDATFFVSGGEGDDDFDDDASPPSREERRAEALLERIMLGLRTRDGVDLVRLRAEFGEDAPREVLEALAAQPDGLAALTREREGGGEEEETPLEAADLDDATFARVRLTDPEGLAVSTEIIANIVASAPSMKAL
jgi:oxygen-independent coproporphyrinogen-3 oxidase